jgi:YaiO family outer membrane protein
MPFGPLIGRINHANRFNIIGQQFEIDAYPKIMKGMYAYLNAGFSSSTALFPGSRYGGEVYKSLPNAFEASLGLRQLNFSSSNVVYTASIGKYYGNYWLSYRHYYTPSTSNSGQIWIRRYFADVDDYMTFKIGLGVSPDEDVSTLAIYQLNSQRMSADFQKKFNDDMILKGTTGIEREEINAGNYRNKLSFDVGIKKLF